MLLPAGQDVVDFLPTVEKRLQNADGEVRKGGQGQDVHEKQPRINGFDELVRDGLVHFFIKRYNKLSIRKPETTNKAKATSFNKTNVELFYKNLKKVISRYHFKSQDIWNRMKLESQLSRYQTKYLFEKITNK